MAGSSQDQWAQWLLHRRHGDDPEQLQALLTALYQVRDTVLAHATVAEGDMLLDVGAGDGLIAFGALPLVGERGKVIFSDISPDLLDHCRALAGEIGALDRCEFLAAPADDLSALQDGSVDVVTTRSVLIYVSAKQQAFREFHRVLRSGGRLSIFEPINRFGYPELWGRYWGFDVGPIATIAHKVRAVYERLQPIETDPMLDFDERDLLAFVEQAGFHDIHLELRADIVATSPTRWEVYLRQAGNPKIPTLEEAMESALTPAEAAQFAARLRPLVEAGQGVRHSAVAYLWAEK